MNKIQPFQALRYNDQKVSLNEVVSPPYDVIDAATEKHLTKNKFNSIYLTYNVDRQAGKRRYECVADRLLNWRDENILIKDPKPAFYILEERFVHEGKKHIRNGVFALVPVVNNPNIVPHEKVYADAVSDRLDLISTIHAHVSPIFLISEDRTNKLRNWLIREKKKTNMVRYRYELGNIRYRLGIVTAPATLEHLQTLLSKENLLIADGHHRFATAQRYSRQQGKEQHILALIAPSSGVIFTYNKILEDIMNTTDITTAKIIDMCKTKKLLPQKTTYFYPKVMSGFVFSQL